FGCALVGRDGGWRPPVCITAAGTRPSFASLITLYSPRHEKPVLTRTVSPGLIMLFSVMPRSYAMMTGSQALRAVTSLGALECSRAEKSLSTADVALLMTRGSDELGSVGWAVPERGRILLAWLSEPYRGHIDGA